MSNSTNNGQNGQTSNSGIIRVKKDARYFVASNEPFQDKGLSWEAKGVMAFLLSKPDNWTVRPCQIRPNFGYLMRLRERNQKC